MSSPPVSSTCLRWVSKKRDLQAKYRLTLVSKNELEDTQGEDVRGETAGEEQREGNWIMLTFTIQDTHTWAREPKKRDVTQKAQPCDSSSALSGATEGPSLWRRSCEEKSAFHYLSRPASSLLGNAFQRGKWAETIGGGVNKNKQVMTWQTRYKVLTRNEHDLKWPRWTHKRKMMARKQRLKKKKKRRFKK